MSIVNNLSSQLRAEVEKARPKKGQTFWFVSIRPQSRGTTVLPYDSFFDTYAGERNEDGSYTGQLVDIAYLTSAHPVWGGSGSVQSTALKDIKNLGRIQFTKPQGGRISIIGGTPASNRLFDFLYLSGQVKNTQDKPWFVAKPGRSFVCYMQEPDKTDAEKLEFNRKLRKAGEIIDNMGSSKLKEFALGLEMKNYNKFTSDDSVKLFLIGIASKNPDKIMSLDKDENLKTTILINGALKHNIILWNTELSQYQWADSVEDGGKICLVPPGKKPKAALAEYLLGPGKKAKEFISNLIEEYENDPNKNKGGRPSKTKE